MTEPSATAPRFAISGRIALGRAPDVLAVGPEGVAGTGTVANALYEAEQALRDHWPRQLSALRHVVEGQSRSLVFALHPAGGPVALRIAEDGAATIEGDTGLAGPGYHRFLGEVATVLGGAIEADWTVPEEPGLERRFLEWLRGCAADALTAWLSQEHRPAVHWLPPLAPGVGHWQGRGAVATMVGPRPEAWLQAVVADPAAGIDAFPWWEPGLGPATLVGRARCVLWRDVRWRTPTCAEELAALAEVSNLLTEAWEADPGLQDAPWGAWLEVLTLLEEAEGRRERVRARTRAEPPAGYRRYAVREALPGGWTITLPGSMGVSWSEEEGWCAWDQGRTAWFTALEGQGRSHPPEAEGEVVARLQEPDGDAVLCRTTDEEGDVVHVLGGTRLQDGHLALVTLAWQDDPGGRAWAEGAWRSLQR